MVRTRLMYSPPSHCSHHRMDKLARWLRPSRFTEGVLSVAQSNRNRKAWADSKLGRQKDASPGLSAVEGVEVSRLWRGSNQLLVESDIRLRLKPRSPSLNGIHPPFIGYSSQI